MKGDFYVKESNDGDLPMPARKVFPQCCSAEKQSKIFLEYP